MNDGLKIFHADMQLQCMWHAAPLPGINLGSCHSKFAMRSELLEKAQAARIEALAKVRFASALAQSCYYYYIITMSYA